MTVGLPVPGVDVKLVPDGDQVELRFRGPNGMPGYWRDQQQTAKAFDEDGLHRTRHAAKWADPAAVPLLARKVDLANKKVSDGLEGFSFNTAMAGLMEL